MRGSTSVRQARRAVPFILPLLSVMFAMACMKPPGSEPGRTTTTATRPPTNSDSPPDIVVHGGGRTLSLRPFTYCWIRLCADGQPPDPLPDIGSANDVTLTFPVDGWSFHATFVPAGAQDGFVGAVTPIGRHTYRVTPALPGYNAWNVHVFGRGPEGDIAVAFRWAVTA
jgi:hypothetical protein